MIALLLIPLLFALWVLLLRCRRNHPHLPLLTQYRYAHRGYHQKPTVPENSIAAFRRAVEAGYGAELDIHLMKDGHLAVIHDSSLLRTAGADVAIEDLTREELAQYRLEESDEQIPLLEDVLALFEGKTPLIVELKAEGGNHAALSAAAARLLDTYKGDYCIESFDPRVVHWFRRHRPSVCRGQLSCNLVADRTVRQPLPVRFILTNLLSNIAACPDFVAYKYEDRRNLSLRLCRAIWRPGRFNWTIDSQSAMTIAESEGAVCIFEQFEPR